MGGLVKAHGKPLAEKIAKQGSPSPSPSPDSLEEKKEVPPLPPTGVCAPDLEKFWNAYPRKVGKLAAEKAWAKAKKRKDFPNIEAILLTLEKQKASKDWTKDGGQFIPLPATWLNQGRWADEIETPAKKEWKFR